MSKQRSNAASSSADERGAAMVEFALVLPILLMLVFGLYNFGRGYHAKIELTGAVREGARAAALGQTTGQVQATVIAASPGLNPILTVTSVTACPLVPIPGSRAVVRATQNIAYNIPFFGQGTWTITALGVMRCGV